MEHRRLAKLRLGVAQALPPLPQVLLGLWEGLVPVTFPALRHLEVEQGDIPLQGTAQVAGS